MTLTEQTRSRSSVYGGRRGSAARADLFEDSAECLVGGHVEHDVLVRWRVAVSRVHLPQRRVAVGDVIEAHRDDVNVTQSLVVDELVQAPEACNDDQGLNWAGGFSDPAPVS